MSRSCSASNAAIDRALAGAPRLLAGPRHASSTALGHSIGDRGEPLAHAEPMGTEVRSCNTHHCKGAGMLLLISLFSGMASAQVSTSATKEDQPSRPASQLPKSLPASELPKAFLGAWTPLGRGYLAIGDLALDEQSLTWGNCLNAPYRTLRQIGEAYLVQFLLATPACHVSGEASFLIIEPADRGIEVSICRDPTEFNKPKTDRRCSYGVLVSRKTE